MSSMQAALGLAQLERVDELIRRKREIFQWYKERLQDVPGITLNAEPSGTKNSFWMNTIILDESYGLEKIALMQDLRAHGIDTRPFFHPLSSLPAYKNLPEAANAARRNTTSYSISPRGLNLPSGLNLTREKVGRVCDALQEVLHSKRKPAAKR
jgi:perosamine synthetase